MDGFAEVFPEGIEYVVGRGTAPSLSGPANMRIGADRP
jgi:hypothetical protein